MVRTLLPKYVLIIDKFGILQEHKIFDKFNDSKRLLDRFQNFKMTEGKKISTLLPKFCKFLSESGVVIPAKFRFCNECNDKITCNGFNSQVIETREFEANLNLIKRQNPNQFGYMLPHFKEEDDIFVKVRLLYILSFYIICVG